MSLASVGVLVSCMALIGAAMLVTFNVDRAMATVKNENVVMAYLNDYNSVRYSEKNMLRLQVPQIHHLPLQAARLPALHQVHRPIKATCLTAITLCITMKKQRRFAKR